MFIDKAVPIYKKLQRSKRQYWGISGTLAKSARGMNIIFGSYLKIF